MGKKERIKYVFTILLFLFHIDIYPVNKKIKSVIIKENLSIGEIDDSLLYQWAGVATDDKGNIFLTDLKDYSIKKFSREGQLLKRCGGKGQGPGEFNSPALIRCSNDRLYISEIYKTGIQIFNENLEYLSTISINHPIHCFEIIPSQEIAVSGPKLDASGNYSSIYFYDLSGSEVKRINYGTKEKIPMLNMIEFQLDEEINIYIAYLWIDKIKKLDKNGVLIFEKRLFGLKKPFLKESKNNQFGKFPEKVIYKGINLDIHRNIFILGGHVSENPSRDIYILDNMGELIATITLEEPSHTIYIDKRNFLYTSVDQGITLKKYSIEYVYE